MSYGTCNHCHGQLGKCECVADTTTAEQFLDGLGEMAQARADAETLGNEYDGEPPQVEVVTRWYARGGDVVRMGPYETQAAAMRALVLVGSDPEKPSYPPNAYAWPEEFQVIAQGGAK